jgi:uncharacterized protein (DUF342 family)
VSCGGSVNITGKGLIVGGSVSALSSVTANTIGSASATPTVIEVGNAPGLLKRVNEIPRELEQCEKSIRTSETFAKTLLQLKNAGRMTPEHAENLKKTLRHINQLKALEADLQSELELAKRQLETTGQCRIRVRKTAYIGVQLILGNEQFPLKSQYEFTCFSRNAGGGGVSCQPF